MAEIRTRVVIRNAYDEEETRQKRKRRAHVREYSGDAIVDTGAVETVVPEKVVKKIGATIRGERFVRYADGHEEWVGVTGPLLIEIMGRDTIEEALVLGNEVLIGQTILEKLDLLADSKRQRLIPADPRGPVFRV
jgi:clan AA aspartic protease